MAGVQIDGVNNKIDFDDDLDTSISANTDDTLVIEAGGNTMATITATTFTINDGTTITTADNSDTLSLVSTDADANVGPNFVFYRNSGSPADSDQLGNVLFKGRNDNSEDVSYAQFVSQIKDASNGTEDARFAIFTMVAGSQISRFEALPTETVFNENSVDLDFRVESNGNSHMIFVDGGNNRMHIGAATNGNGTLNIENASNDDTLVLVSTDADANVGPNLNFYRNSSSPADGDLMGQIKFTGESAGSGIHTYGSIVMENNGVTDGQEQGKIKFNISMPDGALANVFNIDRTEVNINEDSEDLDFRVESNGNTHMLFVDGGNNKVGIGTNAPADALHIKAGTGIIRLHEATQADTKYGEIESSNGRLFFHSDRGNAESGTFTQFTVDNTEQLRIQTNLATGAETLPDVSSGGLCLQQNTNDNPILTFKSLGDVAHGMTGVTQADTYGQFQKFNNSEGGLGITGFSESGSPGLNLAGAITSATNTEAVGSEAAVMVDSFLRSGTGITDFGADDNIFIVQMNNDARFIVKGDGELFSKQSATVGTFDAYEDAQLVRAFDLNHMQGVINSKFDKFIQYNKDDLQKAKLIGTDDNGNATSFVSLTGMQRLHNGAIWQQYEKTERLANAMYELAKVAVGEEKANEILEQNEIKLLN